MRCARFKDIVLISDWDTDTRRNNPPHPKRKIREKCLYYMYQLKIVLRSLNENFKILSKCPLYDLPEFSLCKMARTINRIVNFTNTIVESSLQWKVWRAKNALASGYLIIALFRKGSPRLAIKLKPFVYA